MFRQLPRYHLVIRWCCSLHVGECVRGGGEKNMKASTKLSDVSGSPILKITYCTSVQRLASERMRERHA